MTNKEVIKLYPNSDNGTAWLTEFLSHLVEQAVSGPAQKYVHKPLWTNSMNYYTRNCKHCQPLVCFLKMGKNLYILDIL